MRTGIIHNDTGLTFHGSRRSELKRLDWNGKNGKFWWHLPIVSIQITVTNGANGSVTSVPRH